MKKKEKMVILVLLIITIILVAVGIVTKTNGKETAKTNPNSSDNEENKVTGKENVTLLDDGTRFNTSDALHKTKKIEGIELSEIQLIEKDNVSQILGTLTNTSSSEQGGYPVKLTLLDKAGEEIIVVEGTVGKLQPGETGKLQVEATFDFGNAYDFRIEKK